MKEPGLKIALQNILKMFVILICHFMYESRRKFRVDSNNFVQWLFITQKHFQINFKNFPKAWTHF